jgi:hypothetical protein
MILNSANISFLFIPELWKPLLSFFFDFFSVLSIICLEYSLRLLGL